MEYWVEIVLDMLDHTAKCHVTMGTNCITTCWVYIATRTDVGQ